MTADPAPAARRATPSDRERAIALREEGLSVAAIARRVGFSKGAVTWWFLSDGIERRGRPAPPTVTPQRSDFRRGPHSIRPYTPEEDGVILQLEAEGLTDTAIAHRLTALFPGRPRRNNSIKGRLLTLARQQERLLAAEAMPARGPSKAARP